MMKKLLFVSLIVSAILFAACQKEFLPDDILPVGNTGSFRAKIEGSQWEANAVKTAIRESGIIVLYGSAADKKSILIRVADSGVHNYYFHTSSADNAAAFTDSAILPIASFATNQWDSAGTYGNMNITAIDTARKTMSGTFSLKVYRQLDRLKRTITEGVFTNISYTTQPSAPSGTDTFRVKVDGVSFTYNLLVGIKVSLINSIAITAARGTAPAVGITVPDNVVPGTYIYDLLTYSGQYNPSTSVFLSADTGRVTILEHNMVTKRIRGKFNFLANMPFSNLPPNVQLTEGYFSVKYQ